MGLLERGDALGVPDVAIARAGDVPASGKTPARPRSILAALLSVVDPEKSDLWADRLLDRFGSLGALMVASRDAVTSTVPDPRLIAILRATRAMQLHMAEVAIVDRPLISSATALNEYLHVSLAHQPREIVHALYLNAANVLLRDEQCATGSPLEVGFQPREIVRRALELGATALILAHNHPSGDSRPSTTDIRVTRRLVAAAKALDIEVHDHVIVSASGCSSFRRMGLL